MRRSLIWSLVGIISLAAIALSLTLASGDRPLLGLDLKGGVSVVLQPQGTVDSAQLGQAVSIIERRVNGLGVANSNVARQGNDVVINLPGIKDAQGALKVLGETATLYFRPVYCQIPVYTPPAGSTPPTTRPASQRPKATTSSTRPTSATTAKALGAAGDIRLESAEVPAAASATTTPPTTVAPPATTIVPSTPGTTVPVGSNFTPSSNDCSASNAAQLPTTTISNDTAKATVILPYYDNTVRYILGPADMTGAGVSNASVQLSQAGQYSVLLTFTNAGAKQFDAIAAQRYPCYQQDPSNPPPCSLEAFELDGVVESAPTIQAPSFGGTAVISGSTAQPFSSSQASNLSLVLKYGSLPVRFTPQSVQTVSATIGKDSLKAGLLAGLGGIILVLLYMVLYYRALGLVVVLGLFVGGALLFSIITLLSQTTSLALTLSGVTGIIVSVGITVDSYVVYFERLKDEVRAGRSIRQSVDRAFARAFRTVLTADFVAFLAAAILYLLTVGDVRGFAFMLGLSTVLDVFTAYFFIRPMVIWVGRHRTFTDARFLGVGQGLGARQATGDT
jgi:preprotein translocase subunit SecD